MPTPVNNLIVRAESPARQAPAAATDATRPQDFQRELKRQTRDGTPQTPPETKRPARVKQVRQPRRAKREGPEVLAEPEATGQAGEADSNVPTSAAEARSEGATDVAAADETAPAAPDSEPAASDPTASTVAPALLEATAPATALEGAETPGKAQAATDVSVTTAAPPEVFYPAADLPAATDAATGDVVAAAAEHQATSAPAAPRALDAEAIEPEQAAEAEEPQPARAANVASPPAEGVADPADAEDAPSQQSPDEEVPRVASAPSTPSAAVAPAPAETKPAQHAANAAPAGPAVPPEARFAAANHENIVTSMRAEVLPNGGSMRIRLDPPQLGALQVTVRIEDGLVTAAFETSTDEATRLLGHSLNQLKTVLESQGVAVDKLQVRQAPRETQTSSRNDPQSDHRGSPSHDQEQSARQEQQRREMLRRIWRRLSGEPDPLDLTA